VAILSNHENDGTLSFRDYIACMEYELHKNAVNAEIDAERERRLSVEDLSLEAAPATEEPEPEAPPQLRMRGSSFAVLDMVARGRIARFEQVITEAVKKENVDDKAVRSQAKFHAKLAKFQQPAVSNSTVERTEQLYKKSVKDKLDAFEAANKAAASKVEFKKTWKKVGQGSYKLKNQVTGLGAPPPKKSVTDLP